MKKSVKAETTKVTNWDDRELKVCGNKPRKRRVSKIIRAQDKKEVDNNYD